MSDCIYCDTYIAGKSSHRHGCPAHKIESLTRSRDQHKRAAKKLRRVTRKNQQYVDYLKGRIEALEAALRAMNDAYLESDLIPNEILDQVSRALKEASG